MERKVWVAVAALAIGEAGLAAAQPEAASRVGRPGRAGLEAFRAEIGLSEEQTGEIRRLALQERKVAIRRRADIQVARIELRELLSAPTLDEAKVGARVKALAELQGAAVKARAEVGVAIRRVVSAEQFQKLQQARMQRRAMRARRVRPGRAPGSEGAPPGPGANDRLDPIDPA